MAEEKFSNPFLLDRGVYTKNRDLSPIMNYINQAATYLSTSTDRTFEECRSYVVRNIKPGGAFELKDPEMTVYERIDTEDRHKTVIKLSEYLRRVNADHLILAPTMTSYIPYTPPENPTTEYPAVESIYTSLIRRNKRIRSIAKKLEMAAEMAGNEETRIFEGNKQISRKRSNNAFSGAQVSSGTILSNKTAHSTLTSTCRTTSGYGNANNEKILAGNRHYRNPTVTLDNIVSIVSSSNYSAIALVMDKYKLHYPTNQETLDCIRKSTSIYWSSKRGWKSIEDFVLKLTALQCAAVVYTGDLFHVMKHNDSFVRTFVERMVTKVEVPLSRTKEIYAFYPESYKHLAAQVCEEECRGKVYVEDILGRYEDQLLAGTTENIGKCLVDYADFISCFFLTRNLPGSVAYFAESIRETALVSDTDSTIFTVQDWVGWYFGEIRSGAAENAVAAVIIFFASESISHVLAVMSANMGVHESMLHAIAMKNEFKFDVFAVTNLGKHYFALKGCREGNLFKHYEREIKGVHLKTSNVPESVRKVANELMDTIMFSVVKNETISIQEILKKVADCERDIVQNIKAGATDYFKQAQIKNADAYKGGEVNSPYIHHLLWNDVFGPKYGLVTEPPYSVIKINTEIQSPTDVKDWLERIEDKALADRLQKWMTKYNKRVLPTIQVPKDLVRQIGIPDEIVRTVGVRKMIKDITTVLTIILETIGYYYANDNITRLVSDEH